MKTEFSTNIFKLLLLLLFLPMLGLAQNGNPCDDGDPNTIDVMDGEGNCIHIAKVCNDGKGTTITLTIPAGPECKDIPCDDGDPKTVDIVDINGECHHIPLGCDDGDPTTLDYVDENGQCVNEKIVCDDGDPETEDYLDENGVCHHVKIINNCNTCENDKTPPTADCRKELTVKLGDGGMVEIWPSELDNGSFDECSDVSLSINKSKFDCDDLGYHYVTLTVKDEAGNSSTCKTKVKVTDPDDKCFDPCEPDETKPWAECKEWIKVPLGDGGMVEIWPSELDNGSKDDCGEVTLSIDKKKFDCDDIGLHKVMLTVKDKAGNTATCKTLVEIHDPYNKCYDPCEPDETKPWAECKEWIEVHIGEGGMVQIWPSEIDNGSKDDCSDVWLSIDKNKFDCDDVGKMHTVTLTVKDKAGNKAYCKSQVKVTDPYNYCDPCKDDETKPWAECKEWIEVHIGEGGMVQIWPSEIDNGSKDDCSDVWLSIDKDKFDCDDVGKMHTVTLTVKDKAGNKAYCKSQVKVTDPYNKCNDPCKYDKEAPDAKCKPVVHAKIGKDGVVYVDPNDIDNGSKDNCGDVWLSLSQNKFSCDDLGWNRVTLTVKDKAGNTDKCYSYVKVDDPHKYCYDPCDPDTGRPWAKCKDDITVELGHDGYKNISVFDINDGSKDDCSEVWLSIDKTRFSCDDLGYKKVTLTVTDKAGNKAYCDTKVKVTDPKGACTTNTCEPDKEAPEAKCKDIIVEIGRNKSVSIDPQDLDDGSYDQCGEVKLYIDKNRFDCNDLGVQYVELTVKDKSGNTDKCTSKVSVTDPEDYCGMKMNDCDPDKLEACEISMVWYTCTTLKICIGKHEFSNIIIDRDKKGFQNEDIDIKFDNLKGLTFYYDVEKYGLPNGFWIKSANKCGKCDDDDDDDDSNDWYGDRCPPNQGAGKYYKIPKMPEKCPTWGITLGGTFGFETGGYYNSNLQQSNNFTEQAIIKAEAQEYVGPSNLENVNIFPNPSSNKVFVAFDGFEQNELQVLIYNAMGEQLRKLKTQPAREPQDLGVDDMPSGLYYLRVVKPNGEFIAKEFVIKR